MRTPVARTAARVRLRLGLCVIVLTATQFHGAARGQETSAGNRPPPAATNTFRPTEPQRRPIIITTPALGMTGWRPDPVITIKTHKLGMTGWHREPITITTEVLGMTGWERDPLTITTETLGMTGWQRAPVTITTRSVGMTGWAAPPETCTAPFVRDSAGEECVCPPNLLPSGDSCIAAGTGPPFDLTVEHDATKACEAGKRCRFDIRLVNVGDGPFRGPLVVRNEFDPPGAQLSTTGSGWSCAADRCINPGVTLAPGGSETLTVDVRLPASGARASRLQQCAEIELPEPGDAPVRFVQLMLRAAGIDAGPADNRLGGKTRRGIAAYRKSADLPAGGNIDEPLIASLRGLVPDDPHPENNRSCTEARIID